MSIDLQFPSGICVGGEVLHGEVELRFPLAQKEKIQEVSVYLRGSIFVKIKRSSGRDKTVRRETVDIVRQDCMIWNRKRGDIPTGNKTLRLPFQFQIPLDAPPSFQYSGRTRRRSQRHEGTVGYYIEVIGVRSGLFKKNRKIRRALAVLPADPRGAPISRELQRLGVAYPTRMREFKKNIRRGLLGRSATVRMQLTLPTIDTFPLFTRFPYILHIVTLTKRMKFYEKQEDPDVKLFPTPPTRPSEVHFGLRRHVSLRAKNFKANGTEHVSCLGGLGKGYGKQHVDVEVMPREWLPSERKDGEGSWMQETTMRSFIDLRWSPTFSTTAMSISYSLYIQVKFPGLGNNLNVEIPIHVTSGLSNSPESDASFTRDYEDLDLPPPYWSACEQWGEADEE